MLKNLPKTAHHQVICEANFLRLKKLMGSYAEKEYCFEVLDVENIPQKISFLVLDRTMHTIVLEAKQNHKNKNKYNNFSLRILVSLDAKLAETISYQGERAIPSFLKQTNIQSKDEKYQQNRFLTEWLESIFSSGILPKKNIKNILDKNV